MISPPLLFNRRSISSVTFRGRDVSEELYGPGYNMFANLVGWNTYDAEWEKITGAFEMAIACF